MTGPEVLKSHEYLQWLLEESSFDHDGVIADTRSLVTNSFNNKFGTNYSPNDMRHFHSVVDWGIIAGLTQIEAEEENQRLWYTPESLIAAEPVPGAIEFLHRIYSAGCNVIINSSRFPRLYDCTVEWYKRYAPFMPADRIRIGLPDIKDGAMTKSFRIISEQKRIHFEDVPDQARDIALYTRANVFLLSNLATPYLRESGKLTHIKGINGKMPDFRPINEIFFG